MHCNCSYTVYLVCNHCLYIARELTMGIKSVAIPLVLISLVSQGLSICDDSNEVLANVCYKLFRQVEDALVQDKGNEYRLRKAFFYAPNANPVLMKVIYNISFAINITEDVQLQPNYCTSDTGVISVNGTRFFEFGWTSSGVFTVFHPLTINFMQIQVPFALMKIMFNLHKFNDPTESGPEAQTFLWDGSYELPTLHINLHFSSLVCLPTVELFNSILSDFNSLVSA